MRSDLADIYLEQMGPIIAEEKLRHLDVLMVANAEKRSDREKAINEWRRAADKDNPQKYQNTQPRGFGVKKNG